MPTDSIVCRRPQVQSEGAGVSKKAEQIRKYVRNYKQAMMDRGRIPSGIDLTKAQVNTLKQEWDDGTDDILGLRVPWPGVCEGLKARLCKQ